MSNGDDEPDIDADEEGSGGAADQPSAEKAGAAESEMGAGEDNPTAQEIAADEDTGPDDDGPAGEADEEARLEADQMEAERAEEESTSGDDAEVDAPDEAAAERDETEDDASADEGDDDGQEADAESDGAGTSDEAERAASDEDDQGEDEAADDMEAGNGAPDEGETDETPTEESGDESADETEAEDKGASEDPDEADPAEEDSPADEGSETDESDAAGDDRNAETEDTDDESDSDETGEDRDPDAGEEGGDDSETDEDGGDAEGDSDEEADEDDETDAIETKHTPESLDDRLDDIEARIEEAETEADLDDVEDDLDDVEVDAEAADLPEPDEEEADDGDEDEEDARTQDEIESRITDLREAIEAQRGPYAEDVVETVDGAKTTLTETRWTDQGERETADAVERFLDDAGDVLDEEFAVERSDDTSADNEEVATDGGEDQADDDEADDDTGDDDHGPLVAALNDVIETIKARDLDPDEDEETIAGLVEAAEELTDDLDDAQEWDDLTVREKLAAEGFYDVLEAENRKDFPPEWNAIKIYEKRNEPEPILRGLEMFGSDFMEEHCMESLKRLGSPAAYDAMEQRAQKRDKLPIAALGKIGDDRALETLHEYIEGESDPGLQKVTLKALGEIGSQESTQAVADRLVADNETVRSNAARALGLIGDARAINPLADVIDEDDSNSVRASAAWALNQIGTESALDAAREHADDRSYLVQSEAEKAEDAMTEDEATETPA